MTKAGSREYLRRGISLILLSLGLIGFAYWGRGIASALIAAAAVFYYVLPQVLRPASALVYEPMPAILVPDLLGFVLASFSIALPFWAGAAENEYVYQNFILVHPAAILTLPLALAGILILVVAANYASYWVIIERDGLKISSAKKKKFLPYAEMVEVIPYRRGLSKWLKIFTPLLVLSGKYTLAGSILLTRDSTGLSIKLRDRSSVNVASEAFEKPFEEILLALYDRSIPIDPNLYSRFLE